ncbi:hypothetical protein [Rhodococcus erythropolis]|uniref:hypothetical protein n=1 Tax=Rhodococcus erythropolis TaxID=1833 RepID=UPI00124F717E
MRSNVDELVSAHIETTNIADGAIAGGLRHRSWLDPRRRRNRPADTGGSIVRIAGDSGPARR